MPQQAQSTLASKPTQEGQSIQHTTTRHVLLAGNPNSGKTTLFNALTGLHQKVGNYPGVTVERKIGFLLGPNNLKAEILDLPGLYSLAPKSLDEQIAVGELSAAWRVQDSLPPPDLIIVVADATNLERNFFLCLQILDLGLPVIVVLNMIDEADRNGIVIDANGLARRLGVPVIPASGRTGQGIPQLRAAIFKALSHFDLPRNGYWKLPEELASACASVASWFQSNGISHERAAFAEALRAISNENAVATWKKHPGYRGLQETVANARTQLSARQVSWQQAEAEIRYAWVDQLLKGYVKRGSTTSLSRSERIDAVLTHRIFGPVMLLFILATMFQAIFTWAEIPMNAIESSFAWLGEEVAAAMPDGVLEDLIVNGALTGVGAVVVFLPQILFLCFFLAILEDTGYLARAAFMLDRAMAKIGLGGQSVIPLLSSFACAIPGIMAARTIKNPQDRLITILVAPLMSCSARLPVYALMIAAFIPNAFLLGFISLQGLTLLSLYLLGIFTAILAAFVFRKLVVKGPSQHFVMELPAYRMPSWRSVLWQMYERTRLFIRNAGKVILAMSIVLWFMASYPRSAEVSSSPSTAAEMSQSPQILESYAGRLGKAIEPVIEPLGFDWKIGIGLITSFAAREVMVSTLATIYNVENADESSIDLRQALQSEVNPATGEKVYSTLTAISLMVFFVLACQCMSTVAVVRRETGTWRWPIFMIAYMTVLAYAGSLVVYQGGKLLGL